MLSIPLRFLLAAIFYDRARSLKSGSNFVFLTDLLAITNIYISKSILLITIDLHFN